MRLTRPHLQEILAITDAQVDYTLRANDTVQGKWLGDDPSLQTILQHMQFRR